MTAIEYMPLPYSHGSTAKGEGKNQLTVKEFLSSGSPSARVVKDAENVHNAAGVFRASVASLGLRGKVRVLRRGDDVYLALPEPELEP